MCVPREPMALKRGSGESFPNLHMGVSHLLVCIKICKRGWSIAQQKIYFSRGLAFLGSPGVVSTYIRCGIIDFYGCWRGPEPVGALKRAEKGKIRNLKILFFCVFSNSVFCLFQPFLGLQRARDPPNHHKSRGFRTQRTPWELGRL